MRCALFYYDRIVELNTYVNIKYVLSKRALFLYMIKTVVEFSEKGSKHIDNSVILLVEQRSEERRT